ncbi:MAG: hypothetical protein ACRERD_15030 [Candidatus Binatia bacterium]
MAHDIKATAGFTAKVIVPPGQTFRQALRDARRKEDGFSTDASSDQPGRFLLLIVYIFFPKIAGVPHAENRQQD